MEQDVDHEKSPGVQRESESAGPVKRATQDAPETGLAEPSATAAQALRLERTATGPPSSPAAILALQRTAGNRAVQRLIQTKLTVGPAGDAYEQEADQVADRVMAMPAPGERGAEPVQRVAAEEDEVQQMPLVQRAAAEEDEVQQMPLVRRVAAEEDEVQQMPLVQRAAAEEDEVQQMPLVQRAAAEEDEVQQMPLVQRAAAEEDEVQQTPLVQRAAGGGFEAGEEIEGRLASQQGGGSPLAGETREYMEPRFGADFSGVRVHSGAESAHLNRALSAQAFTHGQDIFLGETAAPATSDAGKRLIAHELTHVVQQTGAAATSEPQEPGETTG